MSYLEKISGTPIPASAEPWTPTGHVPAGDARTPAQLVAEFRSLGQSRGMRWVQQVREANGGVEFSAIPLPVMVSLLAEADQ